MNSQSYRFHTVIAFDRCEPHVYKLKLDTRMPKPFSQEMASNGGAPNPWQQQPPRPSREGYTCHFCRRRWVTHQALGGHMSSQSCRNNRHRNMPVSLPQPASSVSDFTLLGPLLLVLAPNLAFWEEYRCGGPRPVEIDFMGLLRAPEDAAEPQLSDKAGEAVDITLRL